MKRSGFELDKNYVDNKAQPAKKIHAISPPHATDRNRELLDGRSIQDNKQDTVRCMNYGYQYSKWLNEKGSSARAYAPENLEKSGVYSHTDEHSMRLKEEEFNKWMNDCVSAKKFINTKEEGFVLKHPLTRNERMLSDTLSEQESLNKKLTIQLKHSTNEIRRLKNKIVRRNSVLYEFIQHHNLNYNWYEFCFEKYIAVRKRKQRAKRDKSNDRDDDDDNTGQ